MLEDFKQEEEKTLKYQDLRTEIKKICYVKAVAVLLVAGHYEQSTNSSSLENNLK